MPEGDWFCSRCKPNQEPPTQRKKRQFAYTEEGDEEDEGDEDDEEENDAEEEEEEEDEEDDDEEEAAEDSDESTSGSLFEDSPYVSHFRFTFSLILNLPFNLQFLDLIATTQIKKYVHAVIKRTAICSSAQNVIDISIQNVRT